MPGCLEQKPGWTVIKAAPKLATKITEIIATAEATSATGGLGPVKAAVTACNQLLGETTCLENLQCPHHDPTLLVVIDSD